MKNANLLLGLILAAGITAGVNAMHDPCAELHLAIDRGDLHAVKELLANGVDPMSEYNLRPDWPRELHKKSAIDLANEKRVPAVQEYYEHFGHYGLHSAEKKEKAEAIYHALLEKVHADRR